MRSIREKLKSDKGASITFGLLLFLICAVASGVIIVAATAAAGRMGNLADTDQKYYSVTSAAELVKDALGNEVVTIVREETTKTTVKYDSEGNRIEPAKTDIDPSIKVYLVPGSGNDLDPSWLTTANVIYDDTWEDPRYTTGDQKSLLSYFALVYTKLQYDPDGVTPNGTIGMSATGNSGLNAKLGWNMDEDGNLTVQVRNAGKKPYIMSLAFQADTKYSEDNLNVGEENADANRDAYDVVEKNKILKKTTINWTLTGLETNKTPQVIEEDSDQSGDDQSGNEQNGL